MAIEDKKRRLSELTKIPAIARADHRHMLDEQGQHPIISNLSRKERRKLEADSKKLAVKYRNTILSIRKSGAGYLVDELLRNLAIEYTHRYASSGTNNQPVSFNYFEPFCEVKLFPGTVAPYAKPTKETNNLFSTTDYFDFITSSDMHAFKLSSLLDMPEDQIFHYTTNGDVSDLTFLNASGKEFVISGFSLIRHGNSLHWYLLGGEVYPDDEWQILCGAEQTVELKDIPLPKRAFLKDAIAITGNDFGKPLPLGGTKSALRTVIAGEINLQNEKYYGRCIMSEYENTFRIICDDPDIFVDTHIDKKYEELSAVMAKEIENASVMWDLVGSMFKLPSYFASRVNVSKALVESAGKTVPSIRNSGGRGVGGVYEKIPSLEVSSSETPAILSVDPDYYQVETEGHWRRLRNGTMGKGPNGEPEANRTWVKATHKWRDGGRVPRTIYVKSTIESAKLKADEYLKAGRQNSKTKDKDVGAKTPSGVLYILRCTAMKEEIYKVGWTSRTAEERAQELSSNSGVPMSFVVVRYWEHCDPAALETSVHAMLDPYRFNDRREFFHAPYRTIEGIIEQELHRAGA